ncbi:anthrone oxygenase family protein [Thermoflavifilum thermophilum]|uniref:DUF1772 domain-containing protein n=1 Tax=Thermoflavifilum thermophilum TaxID=1393122 RepID=A0A1I7NFB7_9BACT|nr:DUF1772 domain-containing protein [Thermoflavifilum thermophilum]SFV33348.1 protein of unknown function [Thermoflavifilum thermophilum]
MNILSKIGLLLFTISLIAFAISLGGILYQHIVEFPNWKKDISNSLRSYRTFFKYSNFGNFFKIFMPISSACLLIAIFLLWNKPTEANKWTLGAMTGLILTASFTNYYFVPKHTKLFSDEIAETNVSELAALVTKWGKGNLIRIAIMTLTLICFLKGYQTIFTNQ